MSIPKRIWRLIRSEFNHRSGKFDTPEHSAFRAAWEEAQAGSRQDEASTGHKTAAPESPYQTLGLTPAATFAEVRAAYKQLLKQHHPDNFQDPKQVEVATARVQAINAAYTAIKREKYESK